VLGEHEFRVGTFYYTKGANPAAANRLSYAADEYPLYSGADQALWEAGRAYLGMGPKYRQSAADAFSRIVRDYPLSARAEEAKGELEDLEVPIPQANRAAYDRQKYDTENYKGPSLVSRTTGFIAHGPDVSHAAKSGAPAMQDMAFPIPASVPKANNNVDTSANASGAGGTTDVQGNVAPADSSKLDNGTDARQSTETTPTPTTPTTPAVASDPIPTNHDAELKKARDRAAKKAKKSKKKSDTQETSTPPPAAAAPVSAQPQGNTTPSDSQQPTATQAPPATRPQ
jgi:outer membrane protein assembly factor BamD